MTFYFKPPRGDIPFHKLQECVEERIRYLKFVRKSVDITECNEPFKFEYLTDGSALDRTGHFMLRLFSLRLNKLKEFFADSEGVLFGKRFKFLKSFQVERELRTALRHVKEILSSSHPLPRYQLFLQNFAKLCEDMIFSHAIHHTFVCSHSQHCKTYIIEVPFTFCLSLVSCREVELHAGKAFVPCGKWTQLLSCLFVEHIEHGMQQLSASNSYQDVWGDERVRHLFALLKAHFSCQDLLVAPTSVILAKDVDERSFFFPPCMKNLHVHLRQRHRLSHYSRFYYSLFLKDIGMPLIESIEFWSQEYAQSNSQCSSCSHTWQRDNKRYIYSIRHMYGLEGSRKEYKSPKCQHLQMMSLSSSSEGGCPFTDFDEKNLLKSLSGQMNNKCFVESLVQVKNEGGANEACKLYCKALHVFLSEQSKDSSCGEKSDDNVSVDKSVYVSSPVQFYSNLYDFIRT